MPSIITSGRLILRQTQILTVIKSDFSVTLHGSFSVISERFRPCGGDTNTGSLLPIYQLCHQLNFPDLCRDSPCSGSAKPGSHLQHVKGSVHKTPDCFSSQYSQITGKSTLISATQPQVLNSDSYISKDKNLYEASGIHNCMYKRCTETTLQLLPARQTTAYLDHGGIIEDVLSLKGVSSLTGATELQSRRIFVPHPSTENIYYRQLHPVLELVLPGCFP